jgi:hypothetical protein
VCGVLWIRWRWKTFQVASLRVVASYLVRRGRAVYLSVSP